ncbi:MAG: SDR family NAD(P)-dependent oxidoreductase, partial [Catenulispora sp.]|nr:SDR family NAD(P)-dependent oxidoreductase [Catenulispora sp.]
SGLTEPPALAWLISARSPAALRAQAGRLAEYRTAHPDGDPAAVAHALIGGRALLEHRGVVVGSAADLERALAALHADQPAPGLVTGPAAGAVRRPGKTVFVFPGQGSQWAGMGRELLECSPVFREAFLACADAIGEHVDWSVLDVLHGDRGGPGLDRDDVAQPLLFAVMVALTRLWESAGVRPDAVVGHSQGEIAAAHVAGALTLPDAARIVTLRSRAVSTLAGTGGMASVALGADEATRRLRPWSGALAIAAVNSPVSTVISGDAAALEEALAALEAEEVRVRRIPVTYASHSPHVESLRKEIVKGLAGISPRRADLAFHSTVTGGRFDTAGLDPEYWFENLRRTVLFEPAVRGLLDAGHTTVVEISAHPQLTVGIQDTAEQARPERPVIVGGTLRREAPQWQQFLLSAAELHVRGARVDWAALTPPPRSADRPDLPTYAFQRENYWLQAPRAATRPADLGLDAAGHPLLGAAVELADERGVVFTGRLSTRSHPWLAEHVVGESIVVPGAVLVELAAHAGHRLGCGRIEELTLTAPLLLAPGAGLQIQLAFGGPDAEQRREVTVHARPDDGAGGDAGDGPGFGEDERPWSQHATGTLGPDRPAPPAATAAWPPPGAEPIPVDDLYERLAEHGFRYGPRFQGVRAAWRADDAICVEIELPEGADPDGFGIHPALLDAALHPAALTGGAEEGARLPFVWSGVSLWAAGATALRVTLRGEQAYELHAADATGTPVLAVEQLVLRPTVGTDLVAGGSGSRDQVFRVEWVPAQQEAATPTPWAWLGTATLGGDSGAGVDRYDDMAAFADAVEAGEVSPATTVFVLCDEGAETETAAQIRAVVQQTLELLQQWLADARLADARLVLVTRDAVATRPGEAVRSLAGAAVRALVRSAGNEHPGRFAVLDLDDVAADPGRLTGGEAELAVRDGQVLVPRLARAGAGPALRLPADGSPWRLAVPPNGNLDDVATEPWPRAAAPLGPGEVRAALRAIGLNFRDVMIGMGVIDDPRGLGGEGAGVVLEVGTDVKDLRPGDRVMGLFDGAGPTAIADRRWITPMPLDWGFAQAATMPVAFQTAYYGLHDLAGLKAGERILIHTATGGVGQAALQLARHFGAEVFTTASPAKWPVLHDLGVPADHIASSRTLDYETAFRAATGDAGFDVVLNSLAGEHTDASLRLLKPGGRFVEMGKTDLRDPQTVRQDVSYLPFDILDAGSDRIQAMLAELTALFAQGSISLLPTATYDIRQAGAALRTLSQARHTGKLALTLPTPLNPDGTVLITGGTGTLGALTARHLAEHHGARNLLLVSRQGPDAPGAPELKTELTELGAATTIAACDTSDRNALAALLATVPDEHPLTAVIHSAGAIDDSLVSALTPEQLDKVLRPKIDAAQNLSELTENHDLSAFILYSSAAATFGAPGQANYAAANAYLDALAHHRRATGRPAQSLAWGLWEQASSLTGHLDTADHDRLGQLGMLPLASDHALRLFDAALADGSPLLLAAHLDSAALRNRDAEELPPLVRGLVRAPRRRAAVDKSPEVLTSRLRALPGPERPDFVLNLITAHAAAVLAHSSPDGVVPDATFRDLGFDSLTAVELRNRLAAATGLRLGATLVFDHPTPAALAAHLLGTLEAADADATGDGGAGNSDGAQAALGDLDRFDAGLAALSADSETFDKVLTRLRAVVRRAENRAVAGRRDAWPPAGSGAGSDAPSGAAPGTDLALATDDELFAALDDELGTA